MATMYKTMQTAILGGNVDQLKEIFTHNSNDADCHAQLSRAYAELKHRNIPLSDEMIHFVEYELVKASYRNAAIAYQGGESSSTTKSTDVAQQRIAHMVKCIDLIVCQHQVDSYTDVDDLLVLRLRHVYAHVFFLKTHLRKLPLLQMQFCIAVFLKLVTGQAINGFEIYAFTIDIERLIRFLKLIRNALTNEQKPAIDLQCYVQYVQQVWHSAAGKQLSSVPKRIRTYIQIQLNSLNLSTLESLTKDIPFEKLPLPVQQALKAQYEKTIDWDHRKRSRATFKELYETYYIMKQHFSIRKVLKYIDGIREDACSDPPHMHRPIPSPVRIRAIKRTLQVIGEMIKSTRESPNITVKLDRILQLITSEVLAERTKDLRQFFSHGYSLAKLELEAESCDQIGLVFQKIETNLREARRWFVYTQTQQNLLIYRRYLAYLKSFKTIEALRSYIAFVGTEFKGKLIETFRPEQLTEAKLLLQHMLDSSKPSELLNTATRTDLEYIGKELQLRIDVIRAENATLGRTIDDFFLLESYIRQPSSSLERVRQIADWILSRTELAKRHKLVQKTDLMYARELLAHLQMGETDETRRYMWGAIWTRLAKEQFSGLDTLLGRTEQRSDVALDVTVKTMQSLNLPLDDDEYVQFVNRRLAKSYYQNVFVLDNKYRVLKEIVKDRRAGRQDNVRDVLERLKNLRKTDEQVLQRMFDGLLDTMEQILSHSDRFTGSLASQTDEQALEYCLLEAAEIVCNLSVFRDNMSDLAMTVPVITGRNLRNYLAHDFLAYDTLTPCTKAVVQNARYLVENRLKLYGTATVKVAPCKGQPRAVNEQAQFAEIFQRQTEWTMEQEEFFGIVTNFHTHTLEQRLREPESNVANLLLMSRTCLDREVVSVALEGNPDRFIAQLLDYRPNGLNLFYLLINYFHDTELIKKIEILIGSPRVFCARLALKYGLIDAVQALWQKTSEDAMKQLMSTELSSIFVRHSATFVQQLLRLLPSEWFLDLKDHLGNTVLHWAVLRGDLELLQFVMLRYKNLLKAKNAFGDLPLLIAVRYHDDVIAEMLLDHGADPWIEPKVVQTVAMRNGCQLLDRFPADIGRIVAAQMDAFLNNPLRAAIEENNYELFLTLHLQFGYDVQRGELLHLAARLNRIHFLRYLLANDNIDRNFSVDSISREYCFTPFMVACATGHYEAAQLLLQNGANGLFQNENNYTAWHCAVHGGKRSILSLVLSIPHLDVNTITKDKRSALSIAIDTDQTSYQINYLLTTAGVTVRPEHVLHACLLGKRDILKLLIDRQPDYLSATDFLQRSPLMIAVISNDRSMAQLLLERGADRNAKNILGMNCLHMAALNNLTNISKLLLDDAQVDHEAEDKFRRTPLVVALEAEHLTIAEQLIQRGARLQSAHDYRFQQHRNATLLHKFTIEKRPRMVEYLVKKLHFPTDLVDDDGKTADMIAGDSGEDGNN